MGYTLQIKPYVGLNDRPFKKPNKTFNLVCRLVQPFFKTERNVTMNNFFTSIPLTIKINAEKLTLLETMHKNEAEVPPEFMTLIKNMNTQMKAAFRKDMTLL